MTTPSSSSNFSHLKEQNQIYQNEIQHYKMKFLQLSKRQNHLTKHGVQLTQYLKQSLQTLKQDVKKSVAMCSRDFRVLGAELLLSLQKIHLKERKQQEMESQYHKESKKRKQLQSELLELKGTIRVLCRIRPLQDNQIINKSIISYLDDQTMSIEYNGIKQFTFYRTFSSSTPQKQVYEEVKPLIISAMDGYHSCIFAYGQTGSGKTYTMQGPVHARGVSYQSIEDIFKIKNERIHLMNYEIYTSMVEIYNEVVYDLLHTLMDSNITNSTINKHDININQRISVEIRQNLDGIYLKNVKWIETNQPQDIRRVMDYGNNLRSTSSTNANQHSSRSHSVLMIRIRGIHKQTKVIQEGKLVLVDLAGSERVSKTDAIGERLKEAQNINRSLSALGDVMSALLKKDKHIPFRNSKLTHLLQDSLGKHNKTLMLVHVNPLESCAQESVCSLNFASRVSRIQLGEAKKHEHSEIIRLKEMVSNQELQIQKLKTKLIEEHEKRMENEKRFEQYQIEKNRKLFKEDSKKKEKNQRRKSIHIQSSLENIPPNQSRSNVLESIVETTTNTQNMQLRDTKRKTDHQYRSILKKPKHEDKIYESNLSEQQDHDDTNKSIQALKIKDACNSINSSSTNGNQSLNNNEKQVSFDMVVSTKSMEIMTPRRKAVRRSSRLRHSSTPNSSLGPAGRVRTASTPSAFSRPASRVRAPSSARKPKWNGSW